MARGPSSNDLTPAELAYVDGVNRWREDERGYGHVQANRPQTLGLALDDSPLGLLAWIADKWLSWSDPACPPDDDLILTTATIYWVRARSRPRCDPYAARASSARQGGGAERGDGRPRGAPAAAARVARAHLRRPARRPRARARRPLWAAETPEQFADRLKTFLAEHRSSGVRMIQAPAGAGRCDRAQLCSDRPACGEACAESRVSRER